VELAETTTVLGLKAATISSSKLNNAPLTPMIDSTNPAVMPKIQCV
jgi:hypothetical protein